MAIYKRKSGRYAVLIDVDRAADGKRKRRPLGTFRTRKEAERAEREALASRDRGYDLSPQTLTVGQLFGRYLLDNKARISPKTHERYEELAVRNVLPTLEALPLAKLRPAHLASLYAQLLENGRANGVGGLSARTVGHVHTLVHGALAWAVRMELVGRNVADAVRPPKAVRPEAKALAVDEAQRLLAHAKETRFGPLFAVAIATGARRGELCALRWDAVDLERATMTIRTSVSKTRAGFCEKGTKSGKVRTVSLSPLAIEAFRARRVRQAQDRLAAGGAYESAGYVFADALGGRISPDVVTREFYQFARRVGLSTTSFHSLRHTAATWMIGGGVDVRTAASVLGHASPNVTLAVYSHLIAGAQAVAVATIDDRLLGIAPVRDRKEAT